MRSIYFILSLLFLSATSFSQKDDEVEKNEIIEKRIEYLGGENEDIDYTSIFDNLYYYFDHPINLNQVSELDKLAELYLLSDIQINQLKNHIAQNGTLISLYELQVLPNFDMETIRNIEPFVKVSRNLNTTSVSFKEIIRNSKNEIYLRNIRELQDKKGYSPISDEELAQNPNKRYLGSPDKLFVRYRFKYMNRISLGITGEKDQGEEFFKGSQKQGFDFYSAHFYMRDFGKFKAVALGDYHVQFGQGLTIWTGQAFGKSADGLGGKRNAIGLKPFSSVDENNFMRGIATTYDLGKFEATAFFSKKRIDANIQDTLEDDNNSIAFSSIQVSGFHRTPSELNDKDAIGEMIGGGRFAYKGNQLSIGVQGVATQYDGKFNRNLQPYSQFEFNSDKNAVFGADYNYVIQNFNFFGEIARSKNGGIAHINGVLMALDPNFSVSVIYRDYQKEFQNLLANGFSEGSKVTNEKGLYFGFTANLSKQFVLSGYYDKFKFPWLRFQVDKPNTEGYEALGQLQYKPSKKTTLYVRYRTQNKPINAYSTSEDRIRSTVNQKQSNYRFNISYAINDAFTFRNRVEYITYKRGNSATENGYLINQDIVYRPMGKPYSFTLRYALFQTDSYNARIYAYENDVLYYFYIPAYYGTGSRFYAIARYKFKRSFDFWLRFGVWKYRNEEVILSGLEETKGNIRSEVKVVIRYLF